MPPLDFLINKNGQTLYLSYNQFIGNSGWIRAIIFQLIRCPGFLSTLSYQDGWLIIHSMPHLGHFLLNSEGRHVVSVLYILAVETDIER